MKQQRAPFSRRVFLKRTATIGLAALMADSLRRSAAYAEDLPCGRHGQKLRGMDYPVKDRTAEGRFGYMFKRLRAFSPLDQLLYDIGSMMEEDQGASEGDNDLINENPNPAATAGYTFLGQFIDHDITLDNTPLSLQESDPNATTNYRTARYDLDSIYGKGPAYDTWLYDPEDLNKLRLNPITYVVDGKEVVVDDVPRWSDGTAHIPECRNDENLIVMQLHIAFMKFHNKLVDYVKAQGLPESWWFEAARRLARWHYQWMVIHDFLPAIVGLKTCSDVYKDGQPGQTPTINLSYYKPTNRDDLPFMPLEFAVAAYRFGHSMARPRYSPNMDTGFVPLFKADTDTTSAFDLRGKRPIPAELRLDWRIFFPVDPSTLPPRRARKIDTDLSLPLFKLPSTVVPPDPSSQIASENRLAVRNLLRGRSLGLPSGQAVAKQMSLRGAPILSKADLGLATFGWDGDAPLWYYILKEAELHGTDNGRLPPGSCLGPVGGRLAAEVLVGLLQRDRNSYLYIDPAWRPDPNIGSTDPATKQTRFGIVELLKFIGEPSFQP